jgi:hypothetical protein
LGRPRTLRAESPESFLPEVQRVRGLATSRCAPLPPGQAARVPLPCREASSPEGVQRVVTVALRRWPRTAGTAQSAAILRV